MTTIINKDIKPLLPVFATPHRHAVLMAVWIQDTRRVVLEDRHDGEGYQVRSIPTWVEQFDYKFDDTVTFYAISTLTDEEIDYLYTHSDVKGHYASLRHLANGATQRERERIATLSATTSVCGEEWSSTYHKDYGWTTKGDENRGIKQFQLDVLNGKAV